MDQPDPPQPPPPPPPLPDFHVEPDVDDDLPVQTGGSGALKVLFWVIGILVGLALLAGIAFALLLPKFVDRVKEAHGHVTASAELSRLMQGLELHMSDHGTYPESLEELLETRPDRVGAYVQRISMDPWHKPYDYERMPGAQSYRLYSHGPDGEAGTEDDVIGSPGR